MKGPGTITAAMLNYKTEFEPVVPFMPAADKLATIDLDKGNETLTEGILNNTESFSAWIDRQLEAKGARYGIGGYNEHRTVYSISKVFDAANSGDEPRRLHLGTDIWGKIGTPVMAPLDGLVHSFAFNSRFGDYGATIILSHSVEEISFCTLYGHLNLNSIKNIQAGERVKKGEVFAEFGIPAENGGWPPHLHFQMILNISEWKGDYPGVCKFSEREKWLANSPDPDIILQLNQYL